MNSLSKKYRAALRYQLNRRNRKHLINKDFTIISQNCVGGVMLHELGLRFDTPTVNLWFTAEDFIKILEHPRYYFSCEVRETEDNGRGYPVGQIDDVRIYFMHYKSFTDAKAKWEERVKRIHWDNLYIIMVESAGCMLKRFDELNYKHKVVFTAKERPEIKSSYFIPGSAVSENAVMDLCQYKSKLTGRRWLDDFDYVRFLNQR